MLVRVFSEICQHPIARDPRITTYWQAGGPGVRWWARMTGNSEVKLIWKDVPNIYPTKAKIRQEPRCPTAGCINVLFFLLAKAQRSGSSVLHFRGMNDFYFKTIRIVSDGKHFYDDVALDALRLWQQLAIEWPGLSLPPPVADVTVQKRLITITLSKVWLKLCETKRKSTGKIVDVYLPLPMQGTPQNMILLTLYKGDWANVHINKFFYKVSGNKRGLYSIPHTPYGSWIVVRKWYTKNGGHLEWARLPYRRRTDGKGKLRLIPSTHMHISVARPTRSRRVQLWDEKQKARSEKGLTSPMVT